MKLPMFLDALLSILHDLTLFCDQVSDSNIHALQESLVYNTRIVIDLLRESRDSKKEVCCRAYFLRHQLLSLRLIFESSFNARSLVKLKSTYCSVTIQIKSEFPI